MPFLAPSADSDAMSGYASGQSMLSDLEGKAFDLRQTLLRIAGAIQVLEELLAEVGTSPNGYVGTPAGEQPASA